MLPGFQALSTVLLGQCKQGVGEIGGRNMVRQSKQSGRTKLTSIHTHWWELSMKNVDEMIHWCITIVGSRSLCYSAGRLSSKLPEQICSYITNVYLQHSAGYGQDSAGCIATNLSAR